MIYTAGAKRANVLWVIIIIWIGCVQKNEQHPLNNGKEKPGPLSVLMQGNNRFYHQQSTHPDESIYRIHEVARTQQPFAAIVCCSDSRVPPELIFDQGLGDIFVIRTAGNIIGGLELGSLEYAVEHLGVKLVMIMGHENCGAVKAFLEGGEVPGHIKDIIDSIKNEAEINNVNQLNTNRIDAYVNANILHGIHQVQIQSDILKEKIDNKAICLVAARYELNSGKVTLLNLK